MWSSFRGLLLDEQVTRLRSGLASRARARINLLDFVGCLEAIGGRSLKPWPEKRDPVRERKVKALIDTESSGSQDDAQRCEGS